MRDTVGLARGPKETALAPATLPRRDLGFHIVRFLSVFIKSYLMEPDFVGSAWPPLRWHVRSIMKKTIEETATILWLADINVQPAGCP